MAGARRSARQAATRKCRKAQHQPDSRQIRHRNAGPELSGPAFSFPQGRGAGMPQSRSHSPGEGDPRSEQKQTAHGGDHPWLNIRHPASLRPKIGADDTCCQNRSKRRKNPRTDVLAYHPSGDFPTMMRIARTTEPFSHRTCTVRKRPFNQPLFPSPAPARGRITSSCRRWSSWQPSERRSWRLRPSERRSSGPSSRPRQRWHPRRRRSSSQRSCANGASWASPP